MPFGGSESCARNDCSCRSGAVLLLAACSFLRDFNQLQAGKNDHARRGPEADGVASGGQPARSAPARGGMRRQRSVHGRDTDFPALTVLPQRTAQMAVAWIQPPIGRSGSREIAPATGYVCRGLGHKSAPRSARRDE